MLLTRQPPTRGRCPDRLSIGGHLEIPISSVCNAMMTATQRQHAIDVRSPVLLPMTCVVGVCPFRGIVTAREHTSSIPCGHGPALGCCGESDPTAHLQRHPETVHDDRVQIGIAEKNIPRTTWQIGSFTVGDEESVPTITTLRSEPTKQVLEIGI